MRKRDGKKDRKKEKERKMRKKVREGEEGRGFVLGPGEMLLLLHVCLTVGIDSFEQ